VTLLTATNTVTPAQAGVQSQAEPCFDALDSGLRRNDGLIWHEESVR